MNFKFLINSELPNKKHDNKVLDKNQEISKPKIDRVLRWFEKEGDELVGEKIIYNANLEHLQRLFEIDSENPMYDCYLVESAEQMNYLRNLLNLELDTESYDYFIECDRE
jgi:hypothetical protein